jgi:xanthine dehydrogenase YagT iron-sulfur-binding subunit
MHDDRDSGSSDTTASGVSRRRFLQVAGGTAAGSALLAIPNVAPGQDTPQTRTGITKYSSSGQAVMLTVNGEAKRITLTPETTLLQALREQMDLTGAKEVCDRGSCGACTVLVDGRSVKSCMMLALDAVGKKVTTIEGLGDPKNPSPLQKAFMEHDASQCGFCIPGFVVRSTALLNEVPSATPQQIREGMCGNICRCAAYVRIFAAIESASAGAAKEVKS